MRYDGSHLNHQGSQYMPLCQQERLCGIIESKCINRWHQLIKIFANRVSYLFIGIVSADVVYASEHLHYIFREVENGSNDENTE